MAFKSAGVAKVASLRQMMPPLSRKGTFGGVFFNQTKLGPKQAKFGRYCDLAPRQYKDGG